MDVFESAQQFLQSGRFAPHEKLWFCEDRSQIKGRLPNWFKLFHSWTADESQASLLAAIVGELANNSFDHNLGVWVGTPGCLVGLSYELKTIHLVVADRGQGIISSLRKQMPPGASRKEVMRAAFEERISGRAPERRGNGLKFVMEEIDGRKHRIFCFSENTFYKKGEMVFRFDRDVLRGAAGTLSAIEWDVP